MSPVWGHLAGALIVLMMLTFIGIWIWAWRKHHRPVFDQMAQLPMLDDIEPNDSAQDDTGKPGDHA